MEVGVSTGYLLLASRFLEIINLREADYERV